MEQLSLEELSEERVLPLGNRRICQLVQCANRTEESKEKTEIGQSHKRIYSQVSSSVSRLFHTIIEIKLFSLLI